MIKPQVMFEQVPPVSKEDLQCLTSAVQAKAEFVTSLQEYENRSYFYRLVNPAPSDPLAKYSMDKLVSLTSDAFRSSHPELTTSFMQDAGKGNSGVSLDLSDPAKPIMVFKVEYTDSEGMQRSRIERYVLDKELGFVPQSKLANDNTVGAVHRTELREYEASKRPGGEALEKVFERIDEVRKDKELKATLESSKERSKQYSAEDYERAAGRVETWKEKDARQRRQIRDEVKFATEFLAVASVRDYVSLLCERKRGEGMVASHSDPYERFSVACAATCSEKLRQFPDVQVYRRAKESQVPKHSLTELMDLSGKECQRRGVKSPLSKYDEFVRNALDSGYDMNVVKSHVDNDMKLNHPGETFRPQYELIEQKQGESYVRYLCSQVETEWGKGIRDEMKMEVQTPLGHLEEKLSQVSGSPVNATGQAAGKGNAPVFDNTVSLDKPSDRLGLEFFVVYPDDVEKGLLPPGCKPGFTDSGTPYVKTPTSNHTVTENGIIMVKTSAANIYDVMNEKTFKALYTINSDQTVSRKKIQATLAPGFRKKSNKKMGM